MTTPTNASLRGVTTAMVWITRPDDADDGLAFGTDDGYLCIWKKSQNETEVGFSRLIHKTPTYDTHT